eukprot:TRINITY_DN12443_c0_g1_i1.p1 TRINITY_DN12443_c0_g1~~TRINITY_DN12443_c0_g1_i1.p1  ORF type:complete len:278 (+),score=55.05 TRINITY_DN12443_c0_g1_i1:26-859(+)
MNICNVCQKPGNLQCSRCKSITYCSVVCQRKSWSIHKSQCASMLQIANLKNALYEKLAALKPELSYGQSLKSENLKDDEMYDIDLAVVKNNALQMIAQNPEFAAIDENDILITWTQFIEAHLLNNWTALLQAYSKISANYFYDQGLYQNTQAIQQNATTAEGKSITLLLITDPKSDAFLKNEPVLPNYWTIALTMTSQCHGKIFMQCSDAETGVFKRLSDRDVGGVINLSDYNVIGPMDDTEAEFSLVVECDSDNVRYVRVDWSSGTVCDVDALVEL